MVDSEMETDKKEFKKFGTFKGVFVPSTEAILGAVLFLLLPLLTADLGLYKMLLIVVLAHTVTFSTMFSISDIATNLNTIGGGGMYALIKRSLGKAMGGSIGIQLFLAQAASIGFYSIGFAEPLHPILVPFLKNISFFSGTEAADILFQKQILSSLVFIIFFTIVMFGADFTLKIQILILYIMGISILTIIVSPLFDFQFMGKELFLGIYQINLTGNRAITTGIFFTAFAQFFPAVCGVDAGVGMSGDLIDPKKSLVKGTLYSITFTFVVYLIVTLVFSLMNKELLITTYTQSGDAAGYLLPDILKASSGYISTIFGIVILVGILFATGSSALSVFMTAPRTLQSMTRDGIFPEIFSFLGRDFKKDGNEPRFAVMVSFLIGFGVIWMGDISMAATIVGICFLIVYGMLNGSAFLERISGNPSFRPTSRGHWLISFYGFVISMLIILMFSWWIGILAILFQYLVFLLILKFKSKGRLEGVWWGVIFFYVSKGLKTLNSIVQGSKNWRPVVTSFAFAERKEQVFNIKFLSDVISKYKGLVNLNILRKNTDTESTIRLRHYKAGAPFNIVEVRDPSQAMLNILQVSYIGGFVPNTILFDYNPSIDNLTVFQKILDLKKNVLLLKSNKSFIIEGNIDIDIWWRGDKNGNLMVMLAYIISTTLEKDTKKDCNLRIIRKLAPEESSNTARSEMQTLLNKARLLGEIIIIPYSDEPFVDTIKNTSERSELIMIGLPGRYVVENDEKVFKFDQNFIENGLADYKDLPPVLLVKSAAQFELFDE